MKVQVIQAWLNFTVTVQRAPSNAGVNSLGEPNVGNPSSWPVVLNQYGATTHNVRIEFNVESVQYTQTGDRVVENQTLMFVRGDDNLAPQDRVTIVGPTIDPLLPSYFIVSSIWPEMDSVGRVNHYVAELQSP